MHGIESIVDMAMLHPLIHTNVISGSEKGERTCAWRCTTERRKHNADGLDYNMMVSVVSLLSQALQLVTVKVGLWETMTPVCTRFLH